MRRKCNDVDKSTANKEQSCEWKHGYRTNQMFRGYGIGDNRWRGSKFFVNTHHVNLFDAAYQSDFPVLVDALKRAARPFRVPSLGQGATDAEKQELRDQLVRFLGDNARLQYNSLFNFAGVVIAGIDEEWGLAP